MKANQDAFYENERLEARIAELEGALRSVAAGKPKGWTFEGWLHSIQIVARNLLGEAK